MTETKRILINGVNLYVEIGGTGTPLLWSHGLTGSIARDNAVPWIGWSQLTDVIRLMRYDVRGHGRSEASADPADYHWSALARDMLALADQLGIGKFVAGGASMGCATAIYLALAAPERLKGLVLMVPPTAWETRAAQSSGFADMAHQIETQGIEPLATMMESSPSSCPAWQLEMYPNLMADYATHLRTYDVGTLATLFRGAQLANLPSCDQLTAVHNPALILAWEGDAGHPLTTAKTLHQHLPHSRLLIARNAEEVATWTNEIRVFVTELT